MDVKQAYKGNDAQFLKAVVRTESQLHLPVKLLEDGKVTSSFLVQDSKVVRFSDALTGSVSTRNAELVDELRVYKATVEKLKTEFLYLGSKTDLIIGVGIILPIDLESIPYSLMVPSFSAAASKPKDIMIRLERDITHIDEDRIFIVHYGEKFMFHYYMRDKEPTEVTRIISIDAPGFGIQFLETKYEYIGNYVLGTRD